MTRDPHLQKIIEQAKAKSNEIEAAKGSDLATAILNEHSPMFSALARLDELLSVCWLEALVMPAGERKTQLSLLVDRIDVDLDLARENGTLHEIIGLDGRGAETLIKELNEAFAAPGDTPKK
jgi:hypothetical protein